MSEWPEEAVEMVQAVADTKLLQSQRYAEWMLKGPVLEDGIAGASSAQDEIGHVRQLFRLLGEQGRDGDWLEGDRDAEEFANCAALDSELDDWVRFVVTMNMTERASWFLLDAVVHDDFSGLGERIGQDEYFHLEHLDGRLETLAEERPDDVAAAFEESLPAVLAYLGPEAYDAESDPLVAADFTDRSVATLRASFREHYESVFEGTDVSVDADWSHPDADEWDETRRRVDGGGPAEETIRSLSGVENAEYAVQ